MISLLAGVIVSPHAANFVRPLEYAYVTRGSFCFLPDAFGGLHIVLASVDLAQC